MGGKEEGCIKSLVAAAQVLLSTSLGAPRGICRIPRSLPISLESDVFGVTRKKSSNIY